MDQHQRETAEQAYQAVTAVLDQLVQPAMNTAIGIRETREAVVAAQNALNRFLDQ